MADSRFVKVRGDHFDFSDEVKSRWRVRRDDGDDEYICLAGKKALGKGGLDHIYLVSTERVGLWLTTSRPKATIKRFQAKISGVVVEQMGDGEIVLSVPISELDNLCRAAGAIKRRYLSEKQRMKLAEVSAPFRFRKKTHGGRRRKTAPKSISDPA